MLSRRLAGGCMAAVLLLGAAGSALALSFTDPGNPDTVAARIASAMTDDELLGQVFFLGWQGVGPSADILRWITTRHIGGVKIFPRNVSDLESLARDIARMQGLAMRGRFGIPLFVATDQEGGWVRQIKDETSVSPGNLALGASGVPADAYRTGYYLGRELAVLGINMDFAPTADVYSNPEASVIGPRSFGSDPSSTGLLSAAYARGMADAGVVSTAKHFPGHGSADQDSHGHLPRIDVSLDQLLGRDLIPYRILIREGIPAIMTGHLAFPRISGDLTPSSLSPFFLKHVLREELGFTGIVITDDMEMEGVLADGLDTPTACLRALQAGNDMVLVSHTPITQERTWIALAAALKSDPRLRASLRQSVTRIIATKIRALRPADPPSEAAHAPSAAAAADPVDVKEAVPAPGAKEFFAQVSARAVTLLAGGGVPFRPGPGEKVLLVGQFPEFISEGLRRYPQAATLLFPFTPFYTSTPEDMAAVRSRAAAEDTVIFCLANFNSLDVLKELSYLGARVIVISALSPVYLSEVPWVKTAIAVYGDGKDSFRAGFGVLAGDFTATGVLPVNFSGPRAADPAPPARTAR
ncbi:MAG TPA: glycoside hydrolase family 3 protein [Spirochaetia bacterium]|nr:glycoside hydrolase family 3 protein [Spirochaetia bacterium]